MRTVGPQGDRNRDRTIIRSQTTGPQGPLHFRICMGRDFGTVEKDPKRTRRGLGGRFFAVSAVLGVLRGSGCGPRGPYLAVPGEVS